MIPVLIENYGQVLNDGTSQTVWRSMSDLPMYFAA